MEVVVGMVLDYSKGKWLLIRVAIYFILMALVFRGLAYFVQEQLPGLFEGLLNSGGEGLISLDFTDFDPSSLSFDLFKTWIEEGWADFVSGLLAVALVGAEAHGEVQVATVLPKFIQRLGGVGKV